MFKAIFWDNDGTLVDTEPLYFEATKEVLKSVGVFLDREIFINESLRKNVSIINLAKQKGIGGVALEKLREERNKLYGEMLKKGILVMSGAKETLANLYGKFEMGIVTNSRKDHFEIIMEGSGLRQFFDFFITNDDITHEKPDPEPYLLALEKVKSPPEACLVIEDTERGVISAKSAGLTCFAIPNALSQSNDFSMADKVLSDIRELPGILLGK